MIFIRNHLIIDFFKMDLVMVLWFLFLGLRFSLNLFFEYLHPHLLMLDAAEYFAPCLMLKGGTQSEQEHLSLVLVRRLFRFHWQTFPCMHQRNYWSLQLMVEAIELHQQPFIATGWDRSIHFKVAHRSVGQHYSPEHDVSETFGGNFFNFGRIIHMDSDVNWL